MAQDSTAVQLAMINLLKDVGMEVAGPDQLDIIEKQSEKQMQMMEINEKYLDNRAIRQNELQQLNVLSSALSGPILETLNQLNMDAQKFRDLVPGYSEDLSLDYNTILNNLSLDNKTTTEKVQGYWTDVNDEINTKRAQLDEAKLSFSSGSKARELSQNITLGDIDGKAPGDEGYDPTKLLVGSAAGDAPNQFMLDGVKIDMVQGVQTMSAIDGSEFDKFVKYMLSDAGGNVDILNLANSNIAYQTGFDNAKITTDVAEAKVLSKLQQDQIRQQLVENEINIRNGRYDMASKRLNDLKALQNEDITQLGTSFFANFSVANPTSKTDRMYWFEFQRLTDPDQQKEWLNKFKKSLSTYGDAGQMVYQIVNEVALSGTEDFGGGMLPMFRLVSDIHGLADKVTADAMNAGLINKGEIYTKEMMFTDLNNGKQVPMEIQKTFKMFSDFQNMGLLTDGIIGSEQLVESINHNIAYREKLEAQLVSGDLEDILNQLDGDGGTFNLNNPYNNVNLSQNNPNVQSLNQARNQHETQVSEGHTTLDFNSWLEITYPQLASNGQVNSVSNLLAQYGPDIESVLTLLSNRNHEIPPGIALASTPADELMHNDSVGNSFLEKYLAYEFGVGQKLLGSAGGNPFGILTQMLYAATQDDNAVPLGRAIDESLFAGNNMPPSGMTWNADYGPLLNTHNPSYRSINSSDYLWDEDTGYDVFGNNTNESPQSYVHGYIRGEPQYRIFDPGVSK